MAKHYFNRLEYLDYLIRIKATGNPDILARKLNISKRTVYEYIDILKSLEAPILYDKHKETYYYTEIGRFHFKFIKNKN
jgi:predicted DNA-binding transcriptional regulator YafY